MMTPGSLNRVVLVAVVLVALWVCVPANLLFRDKSGPRRNACINNLRQIARAKEAWAREDGAAANAFMTWSNIAPLIKSPDKCFCPLAKGTNRVFQKCYLINSLRDDPVCKVAPAKADHRLDYDGR